MSLALLKTRADALRKARAFFFERKVLEVDPPALVSKPPLDANIDVMETLVFAANKGYLHTSPEYAMKRLLSQGSGDIYFLGHVFRKGEIGRRHNPEFTMAEWYRLSFSLQDMIEETADFLGLFLEKKPVSVMSYRDSFLTYTGLDPFTTSLELLRKTIGDEASHWEKDACLDYLLTQKIEPHLGQGEWTALIDYPESQAAYSCVIEKGGRKIAERFELYAEGVELANGYHELNIESELRSRLEAENKKREQKSEATYPLDEEFLSIFQNHFPPCCGVSVGFDRLLMLANKKNRLSDILPFPWNRYTQTN